jgi:hypothetical protein
VAEVRAVFGIELANVAIEGETVTLADMARSVEAARREATRPR